MNHVILGAGPAGVIAAETLCKHAPADSVTLIGDEPEPPYSRMAIPYLLSGKIQEDGTHLRHGADHYKKLGIVIERGRAKQVDTAKREVVLEDGRRVGFDRLLIATGASPIKLPIAGLEGPGVQPCWTLADARAIQAQAKSGSRVLLMGAGFIGCIILDPLFARGVKLTVVEMGDRMVPRMMGPIAGSMIKQRCEAKGVTVVTGAKVEAIERAARDGAEPGLLGKLARAVGLGGGVASAAPMAVRLSNGQKFEVDLVISATGVRPNIGFLENSGIKCLVGVLTDEHLQTNVPGVYAAGDCAEAFDKVSGKTIVSAIQPNAAEQARTAALNMLGRTTALRGVTQINVLDTLGLVSASFGNWQGVADGEHAELTDRASGRHLSLQFQGDRLIGCNSIGWTEHIGVMRGLVEGEVRIGDWKDKLLADPTLLMQAYLDSAQQQARHSLVGH